VRQLQGQSPYLINAGIYYQKVEAGISVNLMYNRIGPRIAYVGDVNNPHIWEMPFNSLDLSIDVKLAKNLVLKAGIRNLLDNAVIFKQYEQFNKDITSDGIGDGMVTREELTRVYNPGRFFKLGLTLDL